MLTTGIDTKVGTQGNDTFNAATDTTGATDKETFTALDNIDGGSGKDTLNIISTENAGFVANAAGAKVANIETVNLTTTKTTTLNTTTWTGLETLNVKSTADTTITAAATTDVNELASVAASTINGGKNVTVVHTDANNLAAKAVQVLSAEGTVKVTSGLTDIDGAGGLVTVGTNNATTLAKTANSDVTISAQGNMVVHGAKTIDATVSSAISLADRTEHAATVATTDADIKAGTFDAVGTTTKDISDAADTLVTNLTTFVGNYTASDADSDTIAESNALTLAELKAGRITQDQKVEIDAAYAAAFNDAAAITAGTNVTDAQAAAKALITTIKTAADAEKVTANAALVEATAADTAADTVVAADATREALVEVVTFKAENNTNLESVTVAGNYGKQGTLTNTITDATALKNKLTTVTLENAGDSKITSNALATLNIEDLVSGTQVEVVNATVDNTLTINTDTSNSKLLNTNDTIKTLNLVSTGKNTIAIDSQDVSELNISGAGSTTVNFTQSIAAAAVIDASTATGNVTTSILSTQEYKGGSGVDTITTAGTAQAKKVDGGAGDADVLVIVNDTVIDDVAGTTTVKEGYTQFYNFETLKLDDSANSAVIVVDMSKFTNSTITGIVADSAGNKITANKVTATQAANVTVEAGLTQLELAVVDADKAGQIDTVHLTTNVKESVTLAAGGLTLADVEVLKLTSTTATTDFTITDLANATKLTSIVADGAGNLDLTTGNTLTGSNYIIDATAVTGTVKIDVSAAAAGSALTIKGSLTNTNNLTSGSEAGETSVLIGGAKADKLTGAAGNDTINAGEGNNIIDGAAGVNIITAGDGHNIITTTLGAGTAGVNTVTLGNGYNSVTTSTANDIITVGTGGNAIDGGAGADIITLGASAAGVVSTITVSLIGDSGVYNAATAKTSSTTALDVINGLGTGDVIDLSGVFNDATIHDTFTTVTAGADLTSTITAATIGQIIGTYNETTKVFTSDSTGDDLMLSYASADAATIATNSIILTGMKNVLTDAELTDGVITIA